MEPASIPKNYVICPTCSRTLSSKQNLRQHMNTHTGEKPFKCLFPGCSKAFKHASQLSNHKFLHQEFKTMKTTSFDDLKVFLKLVISSFEKDTRVVQVPKGAISIKDVKLSPITAKKKEVKLPKFSEISTDNL